MKVSTSLKLLAATTIPLTSVSAMAHSGEHSHGTMVWLGHMFSSADHLLALGAIVILLGVATTAWGLLRRQIRAKVQVVDAQSNTTAKPLDQ